MKEKIQKILEKAMGEHVFPGAVVGFIDKHNRRQIVPVGRFEYDDISPKVTADTVYDTASITKSVPVALIALKFIEEGKLSLETKINTYIPELKIKHSEKALIRHLLTYTYILKKNPDPNFSYKNSTAKDIFNFLFKRDLEFLPGTHYQYGNAPANLLGIILERISREKLYDLSKKFMLNQLEMKNSTFAPEIKSEIPPTEIVSWRGKVQGEVHDETASILQKEGFQPGCSGLFSNVPDLLNVLEMLLNNGIFREKVILKPETIKPMEKNALENIGQSAGIGWELNQKSFMGDLATENTFGKTGFTGTCVVIDRNKGRAFVMLSNVVFPKRPESREKIQEIRRLLSDIILNTNENV